MVAPASWIATRPDADLAATANALARWWGIRGELSQLPSEREPPLVIEPAEIDRVIETLDVLVAELGSDRS